MSPQRGSVNEVHTWFYHFRTEKVSCHNLVAGLTSPRTPAVGAAASRALHSRDNSLVCTGDRRPKRKLPPRLFYTFRRLGRENSLIQETRHSSQTDIRSSLERDSGNTGALYISLYISNTHTRTHLASGCQMRQRRTLTCKGYHCYPVS